MIYLTGAGCGDPALLTLKALRVIQRADCILYDRLVEHSILQYAPDTCECIYVGKENHHHTMSQEKIQELLLQKGKEYSCVVRLKGGDPFLFGRGGEEALYLKAHGAKCVVIPGIPSAIGGLSYAGIPVTHRHASGGVRILSAHNQQDELADLDFASMAHTRDTLVFMMGLSTLDTIVKQLLHYGKAETTPIALVSHASRSHQKTICATLKSILQMDRSSICSPALIVVGEVVNLSAQLNDFEQAPLHAKNYLVATLQAQDHRIQEQLMEQGASVETVVCGRVVKVNHALDDIDIAHHTYLVFTSKQAIRFFFEGLHAFAQDARTLSHMRIAVVGAQSAAYLRTYGILADIIPEIADSAHLGDVLEEVLTSKDRVLLPCAQYHSTLAKRLQAICYLQQVVLYQSIPQAFKLPQYTLQGIVFTCSFCVHEVMKQMVHMPTYQDIPMYSIGARTSETLAQYGCHKILELPIASYDEFSKCIIKEETSHVSSKKIA